MGNNRPALHPAMTQELPNTLKLLIVWLLLGTLVFLGFQWWGHRAQQSRFRIGHGVIELQRGSDGHYHWPGRINGRAVEFLVDTGATTTAVPARLAKELELASVGSVQSSTAGGVVRGQVVRADVELQGGVNVERLPLVALQGLGDAPLLGMDVLGRLHWQQRDGVLRIEMNTPEP